MIKKLIPYAICAVLAITIVVQRRDLRHDLQNEKQRMTQKRNKDMWEACAYGYASARLGVTHEQIFDRMDALWGSPYTNAENGPDKK